MNRKDSDGSHRSRIHSIKPINKVNKMDFPLYFKSLCSQYGSKYTPLFETKLPAEAARETIEVSAMEIVSSKKGAKKEKVKPKIKKLEPKLGRPPTVFAITGEVNKVEALKSVYLKGITHDEALLEALVDSIQFHTMLTVLEFSNCRFLCPAISHIANVVSIINLTTLNLDGCRLQDTDYHHILQATTSIRMLYLRRCSIKDYHIKAIAAELCYPKPAEKLLQLLNLTSNQITDVGAMYIAQALRTNRNILCLTLADNWIEDEGCRYLASTLKDFCLSHEEIVDKRKRNYNLIVKKHDIFEEYVKTKIASASSNSRLSKTSLTSLKFKSYHEFITKELTDKNAGILNKLLETKPTIIYRSFNQDEFSVIDEIIERKMGINFDPYKSSETIYKNDNLYSKGNSILCRLNLAYNRLTFAGINYLLEALTYQITNERKSINKITLEGNHKTALNCPEYHLLLEKLAK